MWIKIKNQKRQIKRNRIKSKKVQLLIKRNCLNRFLIKIIMMLIWKMMKILYKIRFRLLNRNCMRLRNKNIFVIFVPETDPSSLLTQTTWSNVCLKDIFPHFSRTSKMTLTKRNCILNSYESILDSSTLANARTSTNTHTASPHKLWELKRFTAKTVEPTFISM